MERSKALAELSAIVTGLDLHTYAFATEFVITMPLHVFDGGLIRF